MSLSEHLKRAGGGADDTGESLLAAYKQARKLGDIELALKIRDLLDREMELRRRLSVLESRSCHKHLRKF